MGKVTCDGVTLYYRCVGDGNDLVLIHGLAANHAFWRFDVLMSLSKDYRVTVYDLRGHGYSDMPPSGYTSQDMANDLHHLLDCLDISQAHLIGHSFGGVVALHYAADHPDRVASITIADSRIRALQPLQMLRDWPDWERVKKRFEDIGIVIPEDKNEIGLYILEKMASLEVQEVRHKYEKYQVFVPFGGIGGGIQSAERWLKLLRTTTGRQDLVSLSGLTVMKLSAIQQPVSAIYGEKSTVLPSFWGLKDCLPNCKTTIIPGVGHFFPLTRPKLFIAILKPFLEEVDLQRAESARLDQKYRNICNYLK